MAPRASWKGYLKLSLVSCPVRLYPATSASERISFHQLHKDTHNRINMKPVDPELGLVDRADLVKGYEYEPKQYIILDDEDLDAVRIESNHTMSIEAFVDEGEVDVIYEDAPYFMAPDGAMAEETFVVLREALRKSGKVGIARLVLSSRERVSTLRNPSEVRSTAEYFSGIPEGKPDQEMLDLAEKLIEAKVTHFDPKKYEDRYETALMQMIREKLKGHKPIVAAAPDRGNVINLMDALKASLSQSKPPAESKSKPAKGEVAAPKVAKLEPKAKAEKAAAEPKAAAPKTPAKAAQAASLAEAIAKSKAPAAKKKA
jgi:DNA end-binding protein Ku